MTASTCFSVPSKPLAFRKELRATSLSQQIFRRHCSPPILGGAQRFSKLQFNVRSEASSSSSRPSVPSQPSDFPKGHILDERYEIDCVLGRGGNGVTYRCLDIQSNKLVAIKALSLRTLKDWKQLELFQREAQTLENLDHPGIPKYIDYFEDDTPSDRSFFLVQELAEGESLEAMVNRGWRADEAEIARVGKELLNILQYLGSRRPPVVHRDVKPSNVVIEGGKTGGRVFLVDFGGVQAAAAANDGNLGSTVIGTYGFMAPEQFRGAAQPASDLYGLGATLLFMLSGRPPSAFPLDRMRLDLSSVPMGAKLESLIEGLLEPVLEDRLSAEEALGLLTGRAKPAGKKTTTTTGGRGANTKTNGQSIRGSVFNSRRGGAVAGGAQELAGNAGGPSFMEVRPSGTTGALRLRKPPGSRIQVMKKGPRLEIDIPPAKFDGSTAATGAFAIAWNAFVAFWTVGALAGGGILFALFSVPFWFAGANLIKQAFGRQFLSERFEIGLNKWSFQQQLAGLSGRGDNAKIDWDKGSAKKEASGRTDDLIGASLEITGYINGVPQGQLVLRQGVETYILGEGLDPIEQEWLAEVINAHLQELDEVRGDVEEYEDDEFDREQDEKEERQRYDEFLNFDKKLGVEIAAKAEREGERAAAAARRAADEVQRKAKRAAAQAQRKVDSSGIINLDSKDFDVFDD